MPITTSPNSYYPTVSEFYVHWTTVNAALAPSALTLKGGYTLANFTTDRDALQAANDSVTGTLTSNDLTTQQRDIVKNSIRPYLTRFRAAVTNALATTSYARALPTLPPFNSSESKYVEPFQAMYLLWTTINGLGATVPGFTPPLVLGDGTTAATFNTQITALRGAYRNLDNTTIALKVAREQRNDLFPNLRARMLQYRNAVLNQFGPGHALVDSLPALSPPPGATPKPVTLNGTWDPTTEDGLLTWTASTNPDLAGYSVRTTGSLPYRGAEETILDLLDPEVLEYRTLAGLAVPGAFGNFKVYVVLTTGNERGSNTVKITRT